MATTPAGATLTRAEQQAAARSGLAIAALSLALWKRYVSFEDLDGSVAKWMEALIPRILTQRENTARTARKYYQTFRAVETPEKTIWRPQNPIVTLDRSVIETSLRVTGPVEVKKRLAKISGDELDPKVYKALVNRFMEDAAKAAAGAAMRHTVDGARKQIKADVTEDPLALGYFRVTKSAKPCYFCAMLASRGPVYQDDSWEDSNSLFTGDGPAKAHDNCSCVLEPLFDREANWPGRARDYEAIWAASTKGKGGKAAILAFRQAYEGRAKED